MDEAISRPAPWREVFRGRDGRLVVGLLLFETLSAVHILVVAAVMPAVLRDLGDLPLYGWAFSGAALAMIATIPIVGSAVDRFGAKPLVLVTAALYATGLVISTAAPSMAVLVIGRFVQGAASGSAYALSLGAVAKTLPAAIRPRVLALMATTWLLPALLGPLLGGWLADTVGWRWAFLVPLPVLVVSVVMIVPALRDEPNPDAERAPIARALLLMLGTGLFLGGVSGNSLASFLLAGLGAVVALTGLRAIVPAGTALARRGAPAAALCAFLLSFGISAIDSYVPLMLTDVRGLSVTKAALSIAVAAFFWALGSWWQSHLSGRRTFGWIVRVGAIFFLAGVAIAYGVLQGWPIPAIYAAWAFAGFGMGTAFPTIPLAVMAGADEGSEARELSPTLLMDTLGIAVGAGLGGAALTIVTGGGGSLTTGLAIAFGLSALGAVSLGALASRIDPVSRRP
jgi:MFS family permease